jgi:hypothetical protein
MASSIAASHNVLESMLANEYKRRNDNGFDALISHCRAAFPIASEFATLSLALLVACDLLVTQRWKKIQVAFVEHQSTKGRAPQVLLVASHQRALSGCFVGWQHAVR